MRKPIAIIDAVYVSTDDSTIKAIALTFVK
jgi:hypothetical protein